MDQSEEQQLLKRAVKGDRDAFAALLDAYYMVIYKVAYQWAGNAHDAEDATQEVCIKIGRSISEFRMESKFSSWLYRITLNTMRDMQRSRKQHAPIDEAAEKVASDDVAPDEAVEHAQLWSNVRQLPEKQRDAVLLVYGQGLSHGDVAEILKCRESTVSWYIHEARKELKAMMVA